MQKKEKKNLTIIAVLAGLYFLISRSKAATPGKTVEVSSDFVLEAYRDYITVNSELTFQGGPLYMYLAANTSNYNAVKDAYNSTYGGNFTAELISRLGANLPAYVAELLKNGQLISA